MTNYWSSNNDIDTSNSNIDSKSSNNNISDILDSYYKNYYEKRKEELLNRAKKNDKENNL
jgi:hypothetical protein